MVLLGVLALEAEPGLRRLADERRPHARLAVGGSARRSTGALDELDEPVVLEVAGGRDDDVRRACTSTRW